MQHQSRRTFEEINALTFNYGGVEICAFAPDFFINNDKYFQHYKAPGYNRDLFFTSFPLMSKKQVYDFALIDRETTTNKERAYTNIHKLGLDDILSRIMHEQIEDSSCTPIPLRKKLKHYFKVTEEQLDMLELEDYSIGFEESYQLMKDFCEDFIQWKNFG